MFVPIKWHIAGIFKREKRLCNCHNKALHYHKNFLTAIFFFKEYILKKNPNQLFFISLIHVLLKQITVFAPEVTKWRGECIMHIYGNTHFWKTTNNNKELASFIFTTRHSSHFLLSLFMILVASGFVLQIRSTSSWQIWAKERWN